MSKLGEYDPKRINKLFFKMEAENAALQKKIQIAIKIYISRKEQVKGFANKTASDMYKALGGKSDE